MFTANHYFFLLFLRLSLSTKEHNPLPKERDSSAAPLS
jgi:hypothetical protein